MSYFLCGRIQLGRPLSDSDREELAFFLSKAALEQRLSLQLESNIVQPVVFEILQRTAPSVAAELAFLLTDSPLSNTSDEIVNPNVAPLDKLSVMRDRLRRVERFLLSIDGFDSISGASIFISLASDTSYDEDEISSDFLANRVTDLYAELFEIPSVCFKIRFGSSE